MKQRLRFPIRLKILITLLLVITTVVSIITFTMANLFQNDKTAYIHDLTSVVAVHTAQEARTLLEAYRERLEVFARLMYDQDLLEDQRARLLKQLFEDFQDFVTITLYEEGTELITVYDSKTLENAGLSRQDLESFRQEHPLPLELIQSEQVFVENSTLSNQLPCLTLAMSQSHPPDGTPRIVAAVIRLDKLLHLSKHSRIFEIFVMDAKGVFLAHSDLNYVVQRIRADAFSKLRDFEEEQTLGTTLEFSHDGVQVVGGFAQVEFGGLLAGVQIPKTAAYITARNLLNNLLGVSLVLLVISAVLAIFWSKKITGPIERLSKATKTVGKGEFQIQVESTSGDEIGDLAQSFNQMASELNAREQALKDAQDALVHSEKMAAFGQLGAGIAHEVKNPLAGILGFAQLSLRKVDQDSPIHKNLMMIQKETKRCKTIIENLLKFARQEKVSHQSMDINAVVQDSAAIVEHQLGIHQIQLKGELAPDLPPIMGNANQIQQVLMNLMINAQQAMEGSPGLVKLATRQLSPERIEVRVTDNGPGIPEEIQTKLFEPFFTTKAAGKGTGLGLSVTYGIIKDHKGDIHVESEVGKGTAFVIELPVGASQAINVAPDQVAAS